VVNGIKIIGYDEDLSMEVFETRKDEEVTYN